MKKATDYYLKSIKQKDSSFEVFMKEFNDDLPLLIERGINSNEIPLILDYLRYNS